jgi:drug/metabolite transporter (DMT)-like permease
LLAVTTGQQLSGLLVIAVILVIAAPGIPAGSELLVAALTGVAAAIAVTGYYGAMALGEISIVSPIAAAGIVIPVIFGLASGEQPAALALGGVLIASAGGVLVARSKPTGEITPRNQRRSILLAVVAAVGFGWVFVGIDAVAETNGLWVLFCLRIAAVAVILTAALFIPTNFRVPRKSVLVLIGIGIIDLAGQATYYFASSTGMLSVVSVLGSLYTVTTVLLARAVLDERISKEQFVGFVSVMFGVAMIAVG